MRHVVPTPGSVRPRDSARRRSQGSSAGDAGVPGRAAHKIAIIGNYLPRQCGIATFTTDLNEALCGASPERDCFVVAMNDPGKRHAYPSRVQFEIAQDNLESYRRAAEFLNAKEVDVACLQHEYGIFGGRSGSHVLALMRDLRMPIVTTLHTILADPSDRQRFAMDEVVRLSERIVIMSELGAELLRQVHDVALEKIDVIPHGIPALHHDPSSKERLGVESKRVMLTFGLLSPDKGIEHVIDALPAILARFPDVVYVVVGVTHPHVKDHHGEAYRRMLESRARRLGVDSSVIFHDRFVSSTELADFLSAADLYVTPYLKAEQITSGTLAYAVGAGKAVMSTPYWYACEVLADGRGLLVEWGDAKSIAKASLDLFGDDEKRVAMCRRAAAYGQDMAWPAVARAYERSFQRARVTHAERARREFRANTACGAIELPALDFGHLREMTDDTGVLQHAAFGVPRYAHGYCLDDNARALIVTALAEDSGMAEQGLVQSLGRRYLAFVLHAWNAQAGRFRNFMSYDRRWQEECGSEDSHGRAIWALGTVVGRSMGAGVRRLSRSLLHAALPAATAFTSPRAWAYSLLGIAEYLRAFEGDRRMQEVQVALAVRLLEMWRRTSDSNWPWFEDRLTYCNARLSQALLVSGAGMERDEMVDAGVRSLDWLVSMETSADGYFAPIGSNGFLVRHGPRARFDQQPVEASGTISACLLARRVTNDERWAVDARRAFDWYLGQNELQQPLYDASTGGCRDGLHADRVNENQGAESSLSFLLALLEMRAAERVVEVPAAHHPTPAESRADTRSAAREYSR